jgi:hypothetical protein
MIWPDASRTTARCQRDGMTCPVSDLSQAAPRSPASVTWNPAQPKVASGILGTSASTVSRHYDQVMDGPILGHLAGRLGPDLDTRDREAAAPAARHPAFIPEVPGPQAGLPPRRVPQIGGMTSGTRGETLKASRLPCFSQGPLQLAGRALTAHGRPFRYRRADGQRR